MRVLTFIEIDVPINTASPTTFRFSYPSSEEAPPFDSIPALKNVSVTPNVLDPGRSFGVRASVRVVIDDFLYPLNGTAYSTGTFWGKMRAIYPDFEGLNLRLIRGTADQDISAMRTEHFIIQDMTRKGGVSIVAKDLLKLSDGKKAQAPEASTGRLNAGITDVATTATLTPSGVGDLEYPASGKINIGGTEIVSFTRSSDTLTITRAQEGTDGVAHNADELCQLCLEYSADSPADIIYDLLTNYTDTDAAWCNLTTWQNDIDTFIGRTYSAVIAEPTAVKTLINELIEQAGLVMWWDAPDQEVRLTSLKTSTTAPILTTDDIVAGSFSYKEQPDRRITKVYAYFDLKTPLEKIDEAKSFNERQVTSQALNVESVKKLYSRWIDSRADAVAISDSLINRNATPPRQFAFALYRDGNTVPEIGDLFRLQHYDLQDTTGAEETVAVQIISVEEREDSYLCTAHENTVYDFGDVTVSGAQSDVVLFDLAGGPTQQVDVTFVFDGTVLSSTSQATPAVRAGGFVAGSTITIICINTVDWQALGGAGGNGGLAIYDAGEGDVFPSNGLAGNDGGICYEADGIDTDIYLGGTIDSYTALGNLKAPGGGGGGQGGGKNADPGTIPYGGGGGGGGAGRGVGDGGNGGVTVPSGTEGSAGTDSDTSGNGGTGGEGGAAAGNFGGDGGDWGAAGAAGDAGDGFGASGAAGGAAGKGIVKDGAVVNVYTSGNPGRFVNGNGDTPDATT